MNKTLRLGLDVGSTTVKAVVLDNGQVVFSDYRRHNADVRGELQRLLVDVQAGFPDDDFEVAMTGSGGLSVARIMGVPFIQEVVASTTAIERFYPQADVVIELGGEDAKLTYLHPVPEQRMNGTCAGGTGAFIDQMATLLKTDAGGLDELASRYTSLYPIASRCGVFAKTDVQPLLNQGAAHEDIAASVFQAVATQTIAGLACGHPIRGTVIFLGGPLYFLPQLREAFKRALGERVSEYISPEDAQLFVALGAAISTTGPALSLPHICANLESAKGGEFGIKMMRPLFATPEERADFDARHGAEIIEMAPLADATGGLFLGLDAGSTTIKSVVMDRDERILFSTYGSNEGDPIAAAVAIARQIREALPKDAWIERSCVTGYGEALVKAAIHTDEGEIETMAHYRAAMKLAPHVTSVIDIGGQDMKFLKIRNGAVDSIAVNEACSSGCGSFLQTFAATMGIGIEEFASAGLESTTPVDLGSRCTVFMNSSVKQAQKEGANIADISAGLSYSVVRNALYKVMKLRDSGDLGDVVVAQGGTFLNDAVLRAFELLTDVQVIRPNIAGLMGAYGAALTAKMHSSQIDVSGVLQPAPSAPTDAGRGHASLLAVPRPRKVLTSEARTTPYSTHNQVDGYVEQASVPQQFFELPRQHSIAPGSQASLRPLAQSCAPSPARTGLPPAIPGAPSLRSDRPFLSDSPTKVDVEDVALRDFVGEGKTAAVRLKDGAPVLGRSVSGARALPCGGAAAPAVERSRNVTSSTATALPHHKFQVISPFMTRDLDAFTVESEQKTCQICANRCKLTITTFDDGARNVSGNRCERGASLEKKPAKSGIPNLFDYKYERTFAYHRLAVDKAPRGVIGIPRALGMYEDYPLWFTILNNLGFSVLLSGRSNHDLFEKGMESIPAENVCYPAKLAHGHVEWLLDHGAKTIFFPAVNYELSQFEDADNNYNCPIVAYYPQVIDKNIDRLHQPDVRYMVPFVNLNNPENLTKRIAEIFADWGVTAEEAQAAVTAGYEELARFHDDVKAEGDRALQYMRENNMRGIVLAGRPYHVDPEINHGIPETITKLGMVVLSEDALTVGLTRTHLERPIRVMDQWTYHSRLYEAAAQVRATPDLNLVQLNSFGCGVDAITTDQVQEIIEGVAANTDGQRPPQSIYTVIKIDEVSNLGAATIRLRSLQAATVDRLDVEGGVLQPAPSTQTPYSTHDQVATRLGQASAPSPARTGLPPAIAAAPSLRSDRPFLLDTPTKVDVEDVALRDFVGEGKTAAVRLQDGAPVLERSVSGARGLACDEVAAPAVERSRNATSSTATASDSIPAIPIVAADPKRPYTKEMKAAGFTIFAPQLAPIHLRMLEPIFHRAGYNVHVLEKASNEDVECGLKFVHNDACFPAIMVIGQLINAFVSGGADPDRSAVMITQTGGMCRATNYVGMLRRGLKQAGYPQVPVLALSTQGFEANPGFKITVPMITAALQAITIGDCIQNVLLRVRPYERDEGSANALYARWDSITREYFSNDHYSKTYGGKLSYKRLLRLLVAEFDELPLLDIPRKPRIGVVGEILVKFQPDANNNVVGVIENEGCEAVLPGITSFLIYGMAPAQWRLDNLGVGSKKGVFGNKLAVKLIEGYAKPMIKALKSANGKFSTPESIYEILERAQHVISPGTNAGEGWFLVGEMMELIESGTPNIICCQPFACLPNHVVGRGMFGELRRQYRDANIVSIDYDPGAPEVNQLNRIKLMVATAHKNAGTQGTLARWDDEADDAKTASMVPAS